MPKTMLSRTSVVMIGLVLLAGTVTAGAEPVRETVDGVVHVRNGAEPTGGRETLKLAELWRVGGEDDEEVLFGLIPRADVDDEGNIHVLDSQLNQVLVFSPDGDLLRTLFREGEGPGEVRRPRDMMVLGDGRVGLVQEFPGIVILVDKDGDPAGRLPVGGSSEGLYGLTGCDAAGDHIVVSGNTQSPGDSPGVSDRDYFLGSIDEQGVITERYHGSHSTYNFNDFKFIEREHTPTYWWCFAAGADGSTVAYLDRDLYELHVFAPGGRREMVISRDFEPIDRSDEEYEDTRQIYDSALNSLPVPYELIVERRAPAIAYIQRGVRLREDGTIWALGARGVRDLPAGVLAIWDVFDQSGEFVKQVVMEGPGDPLKDGLFFAGPDRLVVVKGYMESLAAQFGQGTTVSGEEDDEDTSYLAVVCYELVR